MVREVFALPASRRNFTSATEAVSGVPLTWTVVVLRVRCIVNVVRGRPIVAFRRTAGAIAVEVIDIVRLATKNTKFRVTVVVGDEA